MPQEITMLKITMLQEIITKLQVITMLLFSTILFMHFRIYIYRHYVKKIDFYSCNEENSQNKHAYSTATSSAAARLQ